MPRKIMKVVKKLKFWSRKRKKSSSTRYILESQTYCVRPCSVQPSAPPLPPWLELESKQTHYDFPSNHSHYYCCYCYNHDHHSNTSQQDLEPKHCVCAEAKQDRAGFVSSPEITRSSHIPGQDNGAAYYQQHVDPGYGHDEYGKKINATVDDGGFGRRERERSGGFFGCIVNWGVHIIRCLCPCLTVREITYHRLSLSQRMRHDHDS